MNGASRYFDRYEAIAIAVPGAALLFLTSVVFYRIEPIALLRAGVGGFGLFALCAFVVGHIVQSIGKFIEDFYDKLARRTFWELVRNATRHDAINKKIESLIGCKFDETNEAYARRMVMFCVRTCPNNCRILDALKISAGLNRGLLVASFAGTWMAIARKDWLATGLLLFSTLAIFHRAKEFADKYELEVLAIFSSA